MRAFKRRYWRIAATVLALTAQASFATDYYVNPNSWGDWNSGKSRTWPWKTLDKVNSFNFAPGDRVLFFKGGVWEGTLKARNGVKYGSYGEDAKAPIIRASSNVGAQLAWSRYQGNIYGLDRSNHVD